MAQAHGHVDPAAAVAGAPRTQSVLILGAGLAGLAAGYELVKAGHRVTLLEAQLRPGGRVRTLREPFANGLYAEVGASRILSCHERVKHYAWQLGLGLLPFLAEEGDAIDYLRGRAVRVSTRQAPPLSAYPLALRPDEQRMSIAEVAQAVFGPLLATGLDPREPTWPLGPLRELDQCSLEDVVGERGFSPDITEALALGYRDRAGLDISLLYMLRQFALEHKSRGLLKIAGGNDRLPYALAAALSSHIYYGCQVVGIEAGPECVLIRYKQNGTLKTARAERALCTLPLPLLREVAVVPAFSPGKTLAVQQVRYGSASRILLQVNRRSWREQGLLGAARTDLPSELWDPSFEQPGERGLLHAYFRLSASEHFRALGATSRLLHAIAHMTEVLPGLAAHVEGGECYCWHDDPWARGAVAVPQRGQMALLVDAARPEGRVHFAGEHTSPWAGWMEGALESAQRAVQEICRAGAEQGVGAPG